MADGDDLQGAVLAWLDADPSRGYKRAAKEFGLPLSTVQEWGRAHRGGRALPKPNARTTSRARAKATEPAVPTPDDEPDWDPTTGTFEEHLVAGIRRCMAGRRAAMGQGHGGVARQWEVTLSDYRDQLERHREERRREQEAKGREGQVDPDQLCRRLLRQLPMLVRLAPEVAGEVHRELGRLLEQRETG